MKLKISIRRSAMLAAFAAIVPSAQAQGIPVYDNASFINSLQQVVAWSQQYSQMVQQYNQLLAQFNQLQTMTGKLDGARGLGSILNNPAITAALPPELQNVSHFLGDAVLTGSSLANANSIKTTFGIPTVIGGVPFTTGNNDANTLAKLQQILAATQLRNQQVTQIGQAVDLSTDAKSSMDLTARAINEGNRGLVDLTQAVVTIEAERNAARLREIAEDQANFTDIRTKRAAEKAARGY